MAELNLKQIIDRLNVEFTGDARKLVFWYDDKAEFAEDIDSVELENAKVYRLEPDNQFMTKRFLEREDTSTNYLIYAPFPKPEVKDNHLEDTMLYSKRFFADRASLLSVDLGIEERYKPIIEKHIKFFANKERTQRFYDLEIENFNEENITLGLLSAICKTRTCSLEEVLRVMLTEGTAEDNKFLLEMEKYDLQSSFWKLCEQQFGYTDATSTLEKLVVTMFVTATARQLGSGVPQAWKSYVSYKSGNIIAFLDSLMNSVLYSERFDELSHQLSVLPSYTRLGMAALLPHQTLTMTDDYRVLADDVLCNDLAGREKVLQQHQENGICVRFDEIKGLKKNELRDIFTGKQLVYVYHNQIDARGDKATTEDEVFVACEEAICEIMELIRKISANANTYRFLVTSDHGFIYKRDKLSESEKIGAISDKKAFINRRFIVAHEAVTEEGVKSLSMGKILDNDDTKVVSFPVSDNVFKVAGGGQNFVHGGSSPQEMLVPVVDIKMERGHMETRPAQI